MDQVKEHYVMEMDWKGEKDRHVDSMRNGELVKDYMEKNGFKSVEGSPLLFKKGRSVRYVSYGIMDVEDIKPKLFNYLSTFKF